MLPPADPCGKPQSDHQNRRREKDADPPGEIWTSHSQQEEEKCGNHDDQRGQEAPHGYLSGDPHPRFIDHAHPSPQGI